ncbi:hypothetical protein ES703_78100 [subsurface metagenome]
MEDICRKFQERVPELVTGTLSAEKTANLERHISKCPGCRAYLEALQADDKLLGEFAEAMQPRVARLESNVIDALNREQTEKPIRSISIWRIIVKSPIVRFAIAASLILLFYLFSINILNKNRNKEIETSPRYILAEAQNNHLKETKPCDILPPLPN